jgi:hypothetical protein
MNYERLVEKIKRGSRGREDAAETCVNPNLPSLHRKKERR